MNKKTYRCGKRGRNTCYKIYIQDWQKPKELVSFRVGFSEYSRAILGNYMTLDVRQGALKIRWVKSKKY